MNSYFFFGFHIFKDFNVTLMCHLYPNSTLDRTTKLALKSYFFQSGRVWKFFLKEYILNLIY